MVIKSASRVRQKQRRLWLADTPRLLPTLCFFLYCQQDAERDVWRGYCFTAATLTEDYALCKMISAGSAQLQARFLFSENDSRWLFVRIFALWGWYAKFEWSKSQEIKMGSSYIYIIFSLISHIFPLLKLLYHILFYKKNFRWVSELDFTMDFMRSVWGRKNISLPLEIQPTIHTHKNHCRNFLSLKTHKPIFAEKSKHGPKLYTRGGDCTEISLSSNRKQLPWKSCCGAQFC